ncbi:glycosyltransferase family 4 protein [Niallia taxi]|uniref:glycosyltransferase family 4 protein n=1 Tax=Niallia taxi TaxID=2499688 RepID=UPI003D26551A
MNVLTANKFYYLKGGSETYLFALENELIKRGFGVFPFSMKDEQNKEAITSDYFVDEIDYQNASLSKKIDLSLKIIFSKEAYNNIGRLLENYNIDIAHLNIFQHQLSPSILLPLKKKKIPIIYTVHDLKVMCPNYKMLSQGNICEKCKGGKYYNSLLNRCTKNSILGSAVNMIEAYAHSFLKTYNKHIDIFITPSNYYREKMIEWGFPKEKIYHIPNFVNPNDFIPSYTSKGYFLYLGRLSEEKGIITLLESIKLTNTDVKVKIVGTGPLEESIKNFIKLNNLESKVELLGFQSGDTLNAIIKDSKAVIMPSEWYENGPLSLIESFALGKPVIGSNIGGIPEHIDDKKNGFLFTPKSSVELGTILDNVNRFSPEKMQKLGENARAKVEEIYNNDYHMEKLLNLYMKVTVK